MITPTTNSPQQTSQPSPHELNQAWLSEAIPGSALVQGIFSLPITCSIDTRNIKQGDFFIALPGSKVDGHEFVADALGKGASGIMLAHDKKELLQTLKSLIKKETIIILVPSPLDALLRLAHAWRNCFNIPIIAITGSVGKTSTKELLAAIMARHGKKYYASQKNQNTAIGVAMNILAMDQSLEGAFFEVGISRRSEMGSITQMLRPTNALITTVGHSHMSGLGGVKDIAAEKRKVFSCFGEHEIGFVHGDIPAIGRVAYHHPIIKFGMKSNNQIQARKIVVGATSINFVLKIYGEKFKVELPTPHTGMIMQALAAAAVATHLGVPPAIILTSLSQLPVVPGRFERRPLTIGSGWMYNDCYNANPESMKAALLAFTKLPTTGKKIAILGDMLDLGETSNFWHRQIGRFLRKTTIEHLILVGSQVQWLAKTRPPHITCDIVPSWQDVLPVMQPWLDKELLVLIKGSRGMSLDKLVEVL